MAIMAEDAKLKRGYKQTEVGVIPEDWEVKLVEEIADVVTGDKDTQDKTESGAYPFFVRSQTVERINSYSYDGEAVLTAGDGVGVGKVFHYVNGKFNFHQRVYMIHNFRNCDGFFFYLYFSSNFYKEATKYNAKNSVDSVRREMVTGMKIPLPSLPEQHAIATALSDVDALITSLDKLIVKKRDIMQATMQQLLTGKTRLPGFSDEWKVKKLGEILRVRHGKSQQGIASDSGKYPILATSGEIGRTNDYLYDKPSVLIGRKGTIDLPQYMNTPFWTIDTLFYTEISHYAYPKFVFYLFKMIDWLRYNEASGVPSLNASTIQNIEVQCPLFPEQQAIAAILSDMDAEIAALEQKLEKIRMVKQGMMQELLSGKTRLV